MRKFALLLVLAVALSAMAFACAEIEPTAYYISGDYRYILLEDGTAQITGYIGREEILEIPAQLDGYAVTSIGGGAFNGDPLTQVTIPDGITCIGANPFFGCSFLTEIDVSPDHPTLETIDGVLFDKNEKKLVCYPGGFEAESYAIPQGILAVGDYAFYYCTSLTQIEIPDSVTTIGDYTFADCASLTRVEIPDGLVSLGESPFAGCISLMDIVVSLQHPVLENVNGVLFDKTEKKLVCYPPGHAAESYAIPQGTLIIDDRAFVACITLTQLKIPDSVTMIGDWAFMHCIALTQIEIPESVTMIGEHTFVNCMALTQIEIPDSVTSIGDYAFWDCASLAQIEIPDSVTTIGDYAFRDCTALVQIEIPEGVTTIGMSVFDGCTSLTQVEIPDGVTSIGSSAFNGCTSLTQIAIPDGVTSIGSFAFDGCTSLTQVEIPDGVTSIGSSAFDGCTALTQIAIPASVTEIGENAFRGCEGIVLTVEQGSYAESYAVENGFDFTFPDSLDWLMN